MILLIGSIQSVVVFSTAYTWYYNYYLIIAVRQYFAIGIVLADQNHVIRLFRCNNIAMYMYVIYRIITHPSTHKKAIAPHL